MPFYWRRFLIRVFLCSLTFPDGKRCGETIKNIFESAHDPSKIVVGVIEQNAPDDDFCLSVYCGFYGVKSIRKQVIRADMTKIIVEEERKNCPRIDQIRLVAVFNVAAKGPADARALTRKIVGNEEFCMQVDSHTHFRPDWEKEVVDQWKMIGNEFAILSTVPADSKEESTYEGWTGAKHGEVPRQCLVRMADNNTPVSSPNILLPRRAASTLNLHNRRSIYRLPMEKLRTWKNLTFPMRGLLRFHFQSATLKRLLHMIHSFRMSLALNSLLAMLVFGLVATMFTLQPRISSTMIMHLTLEDMIPKSGSSSEENAFVTNP
jgi:Glycosyltransferase (GlcNAc)